MGALVYRSKFSGRPPVRLEVTEGYEDIENCLSVVRTPVLGAESVAPFRLTLRVTRVGDVYLDRSSYDAEPLLVGHDAMMEAGM